jgi:hypothetical protein
MRSILTSFQGVTARNYDLTRTKRTAVSAFGTLGFAYVQLSRKRVSCVLLIYFFSMECNTCRC